MKLRSLYVRLVGMFLAVVLISIAVAFLFTNHYFRKDIRTEQSIQLSNTISDIERLYMVSQPRGLMPFLSETARLQGVTMVGVTMDGRWFGFGERFRSIGEQLQPEQVESVFQGRTIAVQLSDDEQTGRPQGRVVGKMAKFGPFEVALFLSPERMPLERSFMRTSNMLLMSLLIIGSLLFLVAARYLVQPLKQLTRATGRLAKGDFTVRVPMNRKDELGELADSFNKMADSLSQIESMRSDFVSSVSHELQSPLTSINGFAEALRSTQVTEEERSHYVDIIKQESGRLSRLSDNMLRLASLDSQHHPFHPQPFRLDRQLRDVVLSCEPQWADKGIELELHLLETVIQADVDSLNQVWVNVLHNAIKFTPKGGRISITMQHPGGEEAVIVRLSDTGPGIPAEARERIFERFYKADPSRDRSSGGSGLGLSIVKRIVSLHGGSVEAEPLSEFGRFSSGTTIVVQLPLKPQAEPDEAR
ncbi:integral membrane sensor signal transduction histidine kinase [Paenibacillus curdlanolyticus YK9]|uniref:Heme sensor protein HssS n=1 Tax=Paenibacillus curdlanolyticus YK9 TaxID=717606 RepID=E0IB16_9BACL|nr:HAMP domain-containing sensor histidine kinase [Paenibacillus curdlanolyticus]EFM10307.1 integral membrane sensor signal transduction histidine kinase [Paenibacillus curdlanolyticus YK9]